MARFESMGVVDRETARALGLVGPCARASGVDNDVRADYPVGYYRFAQGASFRATPEGAEATGGLSSSRVGPVIAM